MLALMLMLAADEDALLAQYRARTSVEVPCHRPESPSEVVVCGRREADRYRVSFVTTDIRDSVPTERARLLEPKMAGCGRVGAFFNDCGYVGMTMSTGAGGPVKVKTRKLAE
jgi:hypothetical protein